MSQITTNVAAPDGFAPDPKTTAQVAELRALEAQFPEPPLDEVMAEVKWLDERMRDVARGADWPYWDQYVAIYGQQVVGAGDDMLQLEIDTARKLGVHPGRVFITYVGEW